MSDTAVPKLKLKNLSLLPIVQGGMGVGVSAHRLAGNVVARPGAVGTISSVDLRRHHADLMEQTEKSRDKALINALNLIALDRELKAAKKIAVGKGMIAVNVMRAVAEYSTYVRQSCQSGADAIVVGAGLPTDLPESALCSGPFGGRGAGVRQRSSLCFFHRARGHITVIQRARHTV